jgi:recombinational DNA repair protein RecR
MACVRIRRIAGRTVSGMWTIDDVIERFDGSLAYSTNSKEICQYIADLLKELKERRKADSCEGCMHKYGEKLTCQICARYYRDKYVAERRTDD